MLVLHEERVPTETRLTEAQRYDSRFCFCLTTYEYPCRSTFRDVIHTWLEPEKLLVSSAEVKELRSTSQSIPVGSLGHEEAVSYVGE